MFCLCFPVGMLQSIRTEHPWTSYVRRNSESSRESGSQPSTLMKMTRSYNPRRVSLERSKADVSWKFTVTVTVSTRHVHGRRDSDDARQVSSLCFYPQCLTFQSPLSTGRKMAASIKSLNLNFEKSKTIPNCRRPPYSPYLAPSLVVPPASLPLIRS